ncbi:MAG: mechanosensitive ion channel family protein [Desulfobacca sp.]|nr:mechanosensitive ion channel family protein [Desulfobacca sp.]
MASIQELVTSYLVKIQRVISPAAPDSVLLYQIFLTLLALLVLIGLIVLTNRLFRRADAKLESWRGTRILPLKIQTLELLSADRLTNTIKWLVRKLRLLVIAVLFYIFIPIILSFFPRTRGLVSQYLNYLLAPFSALAAGIVNSIPNLIFILITFLVVRYILKMLRMLFNEIGKGKIVFPGFYPEWTEPTYKLLRFLVIVFAIIFVSPYLPGFGSPAFQGLSIFFGVLLSLGSTAAIANVVAGAALTYMRPFHVGDRVKIADTMGDVVEKTLLITRVRTIKNVEVTIPNSMVLGSHMINFSALAQESRFIIYASITIGYDAPWRQVHELLLNAARATRDIAVDPPPFVLQTSLNDFSVTYELNAYTGNVKELLKVQSELHQNIQDQFNAAGVEIMSPQFTAIRDGNQTVIPSEYLPPAAPPKGFKILPG